jgi:hypothetical protein
MYLKEKVITLIDGTAPVVAVLGNRYYSLRAPQGTTTPYCIISMPTHNIVGDLKGVTKLEKAQIRFDLYGPSYPQLTALKESIVDMMNEATAFSSVYSFGSEMYEDDTRLYHMTFDFSVWNYRD